MAQPAVFRRRFDRHPHQPRIASGAQQAAVRLPRERPHLVVVAAQRARLAPGLRVPHVHLAVAARHGQHRPIGGKGGIPSEQRVFQQTRHRRGLRRIRDRPHAHLRRPAARRQIGAVRREGQRPDAAEAGPRPAHRPAITRVVQHHRMLRVRNREHPAVRRRGDNPSLNRNLEYGAAIAHAPRRHPARVALENEALPLARVEQVAARRQRPALPGKFPNHGAPREIPLLHRARRGEELASVRRKFRPPAVVRAGQLTGRRPRRQIPESHVVSLRRIRRPLAVGRNCEMRDRPAGAAHVGFDVAPGERPEQPPGGIAQPDRAGLEPSPREPKIAGKRRIGSQFQIRRIQVEGRLRGGALRPPPLRENPGHTERDRQRKTRRQHRQRPIAPRPAPHAFGRRDRTRADGTPLEPALEIVGQRRGAGVTSGRFTGERAQRDRLEIARQGSVDPPEGNGISLRDCGDQPGQLRGHERRPTREQTIQDRAESIHIGRRDRLAAQLLGRHVARTSQHFTGSRELRASLDGNREPEFREMRFSRRIDQDVRRFQVAVQHARPVCVLHGPGHLRHQERGFARRRSPPRRVDGEILAFDQIHRVKWPPLMPADFMNGDNVWMMKPRGVSRLAQKTFLHRRPSVRTAGEHLDRHEPVERPLPREIDHTHPAATQLVNHLVSADLNPQRPGCAIVIECHPRHTAWTKPVQQCTPKRSTAATACSSLGHSRDFPFSKRGRTQNGAP